MNVPSIVEHLFLAWGCCSIMNFIVAVRTFIMKLMSAFPLYFSGLYVYAFHSEWWHLNSSIDAFLLAFLISKSLGINFSSTFIPPHFRSSLVRGYLYLSFLIASWNLVGDIFVFRDYVIFLFHVVIISCNALFVT